MGRYPEKKITYWCYAKDAGYDQGSLAPVPCRKEACERYRDTYPFCVMMGIQDETGEVVV